MMTSKERFKRIFEHKEADRIPIWDFPWDTTIRRWQSEGLPANIDYDEYLDIDRVAVIQLDNSPRYEEKILEETDTYITETTNWGVTKRTFRNATSTPDFLDFTVTSPDTWLEAKKRMEASPDRVDLQTLKKNYAEWQKKGYWINVILWFGFDVTHSHFVGTERLLMALMTDPDWVVDMFNHFLDVHIQLYDYIWDQGIHFDSMYWYDDMGYKGNQFFSVDMYKELLMPVHKRAVEWAKSKNIYAHMHSCGNINPFIPELIKLGVDALNPLEVKAGMDPIKIKKDYGKDLVLHGGVNAVNWDKKDIILEEIERIIPVMKESGGYIFASDHSIPDAVSFNDFKEIINLVKRVGSYK